MNRLRSTFGPELPIEATNLERILTSIPQGRKIAISNIRQICLVDEKYREFIRDYDSDRKQDLGLLCNKYAIPHAEFMADINREMFSVIDESMSFARALSTKIVAARLPRVVERGMIEGAKSDGVADRHFTLQKEGFHVAPKGVQISMNQINANAAGLPSFEDSIKELDDILRVDGALVEDAQLEAGEADYIEVEELENEEELLSVK